MSTRSILAFDGILVNGVGYGAGLDNECKFVIGSGSVSANPQITRSPCDSGRITYVQKYKDFVISCRLIGDLTALDTSAKDQDEIKVSEKGKAVSATTRLTIYGTVNAVFDDDTNETAITATGKLAASPEPLLTAAIVDGTSAETAVGS